MRKSISRLLRSTALIGCLSFLPGINAVAAQTMEDLGGIDGSPDIAPQFTSSDGMVITGFVKLPDELFNVPFVYQNRAFSLIRPSETSRVRISGLSGDGLVFIGNYTPSDLCIRGFRSVSGQLVDLGGLPTTGCAQTTPMSISGDGKIIVGQSAGRAFKYENGQISDLGDLGGVGASSAQLISANGKVIAGLSASPETACGATGCVFLYKDGLMSNIGSLIDYPLNLKAISVDGSVIIGTINRPSNNSSAYRFQNNQFQDLGTLSGISSSAVGMSSDGSVIIGHYKIIDEIGEATRSFVFQNSQSKDIGTLGGRQVLVTAISANGNVIVGSAQLPLDGTPSGTRAFLYKDGVIHDLGTLGGDYSFANLVSADGGMIIGVSTLRPNDETTHMFAYRLGKMIDVPETYVDFSKSIESTRNTISLRTSSMALMMDYDCRVFSTYNMCVSFGGRYSDVTSSSNEGAGMLTIAYRITPSLRVGAFIDQRITQSKPAGINFENDTPSIGAFIGYDHNGDGTGAQAKATAVYNTGKVNVTRLASSGNTEAGSGRSELTSYAIGAELGWGFRVQEGWIATPYAGIRHTQSELGSYSERLTDMVKFPITYADYGQRLTTMTGGVRLDGRLTDRVSIALSAGVEYDISRSMDQYSGTSEIPGLANFSFSTSANSNRTRAVGSAALSYHIDQNQRVSAGIYVRENAYVSQATKTVMMRYEVAF